MELKKKEKKTKSIPFDVKEFGKRVALVRQHVLGMTQLEFANILNSGQAAISRLESGIGGNIHAVFGIVDYLNNNGYEGHMLFRKIFDISFFTNDIKGITNRKQLISAIEALQQQLNVNNEKISIIKDLIV